MYQFIWNENGGFSPFPTPKSCAFPYECIRTRRSGTRKMHPMMSKPLMLRRPSSKFQNRILVKVHVLEWIATYVLLWLIQLKVKLSGAFGRRLSFSPWFAFFSWTDGSEFGEVVPTSQSLDVEDAVAFADSVAAIRRHMEDGSSVENIFEVGVIWRIMVVNVRHRWPYCWLMMAFFGCGWSFDLFYWTFDSLYKRVS